MTTGILANNRAKRREMEKVQFESKEAGPSRLPRQTSSISPSVKADSDYGRSPSPPMETQFRSQGEDSDDQLWEADCILDERGETAKGEYLVKWVGFDPKTGESWEPTWERRDGVTPLLAKEWKAKKKADPGLIGVEGKKLLAEQKRKKEEERRKKREARLAKSKTGRERLIASSEVVDLAKSRSPTVDDETNFPGRKTKRSSRVGTTEKDIPVKKSKKVKNSAVPSSTSSSKNVPVVELPLRPRISALAFETEQEDAQDLTNGALPLDDSEDRLMRLYTNDEDFDADVKVEVEEATISPPSTNKRSAPVCSSPADHLVTGRQKRIRIDYADTAIESSLNETMIPAKLAARGGPKSTDTLELTPNGTNDEEAVVYAPTSSTAKGDSNVKDLAPVLLPSDSQFRALLPGSSESSQITTSTGPGQSQSDPIQQFISPDRVSHRKSAVSAITAGPSKLAKGVRVLVVDGEEVLGVDTDSESEGGLDPESAQKHDVATDADVVDEILASFQASPVSPEESAPSTHDQSSKEWSLHPPPTLSRKAKTSQDLKISALQQMVAELLMEKSGGWKGKGRPVEASTADSTRVRGLAAEMANHFRIAMDEVKSSADPSASPLTGDSNPGSDRIIKTSNVGLQTDSTSVRTVSVASQTDSIPSSTPVAITRTISQIHPTTVSEAGVQTDAVPEEPVLDQKAFEEQLATKDADRKKWRIRAKRAEGEVTTLSEDLQFIREQYQEASASAVREVFKSTDLEEKMTILQGQLRYGLRQRDLHHAAVRGRQDKQVTILTAQNNILLEQSRRTDDGVRSRAAAYHEVETQRERLEQLLREAMRKIDNLSDRNDELVSQIEILRAKQMGVLGDLHDKDGSDDDDYSFGEESDAVSSAGSSRSPSASPRPSSSLSPKPTHIPDPTRSSDASGSAAKQSASAFIAPIDSLTSSQLMPDTQDLLSAEQSLVSEWDKERNAVVDPQMEGERRSWNPYQSPWVEGIFFENESAVKEHLMHEVDQGFS